MQRHHQVEDTIKNGIKYTPRIKLLWEEFVEDTIKNGIKYTAKESSKMRFEVEDTIQNGKKIGKIKNR